jgi:hypothetical protein
MPQVPRGMQVDFYTHFATDLMAGMECGKWGGRRTAGDEGRATKGGRRRAGDMGRATWGGKGGGGYRGFLCG